MQTRLIEGVAPPTLDPQVAKTLAEIDVGPGDFGRTVFLLALRNHDGAIYRTASTDSAIELKAAVDALQKIGLVIDRPGRENGLVGFDVVMRLAR